MAKSAATSPASPTRIPRIATPPAAPAVCKLSQVRRSGDRQLATARPRWVLHVLDLVERHIDEFAADLLDLADVDRLHDVARVRVDRHNAARALPLQALGRRDQ